MVGIPQRVSLSPSCGGEPLSHSGVFSVALVLCRFLWGSLWAGHLPFLLPASQETFPPPVFLKTCPCDAIALCTHVDAGLCACVFFPPATARPLSDVWILLSLGGLLRFFFRSFLGMLLSGALPASSLGEKGEECAALPRPFLVHALLTPTCLRAAGEAASFFCF